MSVQTSAPLLRCFIEGEPIPQPRPRARLVPGKTVAGVVTRPPRVHVYDPKRAAAWREHVALIGKLKRIQRGVWPGKVGARLVFWLPRDPRHPTKGWPSGDLDNLEKAALDALTGIIYEDDDQVVHVEKDKDYGDAKLGVEVELWGIVEVGR